MSGDTRDAPRTLVSFPMLPELARELRSAIGLQHKRDIQAAARHLPRVRSGPWGAGEVRIGDDTAAIPDGDGYLLFAAEGMWPELVATEPRFAGYCAVMVNASDVYAMGGRPLAIVDAHLRGQRRRRRADVAGDGRRRRSACRSRSWAVTPTCAARTSRWRPRCSAARGALLTSFDARPGDDLVVAVDLRGRMHPRHAFWNASTDAAPVRLRADYALLPRIAEEGMAAAAKDISMGGIAGTALMLCEASGVGATLVLDAIPRPGRRAVGDVAASVPELRLPAGGAAVGQRAPVRGVRRAPHRRRGGRPLRCQPAIDAGERRRARGPVGSGRRAAHRVWRRPRDTGVRVSADGAGRASTGIDRRQRRDRAARARAAARGAAADPPGHAPPGRRRPVRELAVPRRRRPPLGSHRARPGRDHRRDPQRDRRTAVPDGGGGARALRRAARGACGRTILFEAAARSSPAAAPARTAASSPAIGGQRGRFALELLTTFAARSAGGACAWPRWSRRWRVAGSRSAASRRSRPSRARLAAGSRFDDPFCRPHCGRAGPGPGRGRLRTVALRRLQRRRPALLRVLRAPSPTRRSGAWCGSWASTATVARTSSGCAIRRGLPVPAARATGR